MSARSWLRNLPNALSASRIAVCATAVWFVQDPVVFFTAFYWGAITDAADGWLARKLDAASRLGAVLDSAADFFFFGMIAVYMARVHAFDLRRFLVPLIVIAGMRGANILVSLIKWRKPVFLHTWLNKAAGAAIFVIIALLPFGWVDAFAWVALVVAAAASVEEGIILLLGKEIDRDASTILRFRRNR